MIESIIDEIEFILNNLVIEYNELNLEIDRENLIYGLIIQLIDEYDLDIN